MLTRKNTSHTPGCRIATGLMPLVSIVILSNG